MKSYIAAGIVAFFLIAGAVGYGFYVNRSTELLTDEVGRVEEFIKKADFNGAINSARSLDETIEKKKTMLCAIVDHKEIYEIKRSLGELNAFLEDEDDAESLAHCKEIGAIVKRISENTMPYIFNIL